MKHRFDIRDERGDIVLRHIIVVGIILAVVIFLVVEVGPLLWTRISIAQEAQDVGEGVAIAYRLSPDQRAAVARGASMMATMGYKDKEIMDSSIVFVPQSNPTDIQVTTVRYYDNLVTKISWFKKFGKISCTKTVNIKAAKAKS